MSKKLIFKNDKYKKDRGGYSRWLVISCDKCKTVLVTYQKDGPGILKRLYVDRMISPTTKLGIGKNLKCDNCQTILGMKITYQKERRPAYRLFAGAIERRIISGRSGNVSVEQSK